MMAVCGPQGITCMASSGGNGLASNILAWVKVIAGGTRQVATSGFHSMVVAQDDSIWATGWKKDGQFGDVTAESSPDFRHLETVRLKMQYGRIILAIYAITHVHLIVPRVLVYRHVCSLEFVCSLIIFNDDALYRRPGVQRRNRVPRLPWE